nr:MAG TPA: hypothetical protein [Microviridae sp.]
MSLLINNFLIFNVPRETMNEKRFIKVTCKVLTKGVSAYKQFSNL